MEQTDAQGKPVPFNLKAVTCDLERNRGGEHITFERATLSAPGGKKKAYHHRNDVRNLRVPSGEIRGVHPILMTHFNGKTITL